MATNHSVSQSVSNFFVSQAEQRQRDTGKAAAESAARAAAAESARDSAVADAARADAERDAARAAAQASERTAEDARADAERAVTAARDNAAAAAREAADELATAEDAERVAFARAAAADDELARALAEGAARADELEARAEAAEDAAARARGEAERATASAARAAERAEHAEGENVSLRDQLFEREAELDSARLARTPRAHADAARNDAAAARAAARTAGEASRAEIADALARAAAVGDSLGEARARLELAEDARRRDAAAHAEQLRDARGATAALRDEIALLHRTGADGWGQALGEQQRMLLALRAQLAALIAERDKERDAFARACGFDSGGVGGGGGGGGDGVNGHRSSGVAVPPLNLAGGGGNLEEPATGERRWRRGGQNSVTLQLSKGADETSVPIGAVRNGGGGGAGGVNTNSQQMQRFIAGKARELTHARRERDEMRRRLDSAARSWSTAEEERARRLRGLEDAHVSHAYQSRQLLGMVAERDARLATLQQALCDLAAGEGPANGRAAAARERDGETTSTRKPKKHKQAAEVLRAYVLRAQDEDLARTRELVAEIQRLSAQQPTPPAKASSATDDPTNAGEGAGNGGIGGGESSDVLRARALQLEDQLHEMEAQGGVAAVVEARMLAEALQTELAHAGTEAAARAENLLDLEQQLGAQRAELSRTVAEAAQERDTTRLREARAVDAHARSAEAAREVEERLRTELERAQQETQQQQRSQPPQQQPRRRSEGHDRNSRTSRDDGGMAAGVVSGAHGSVEETGQQRGDHSQRDNARGSRSSRGSENRG